MDGRHDHRRENALGFVVACAIGVVALTGWGMLRLVFGRVQRWSRRSLADEMRLVPSKLDLPAD